ncbi:MAG: hypothetical protein MI861_20025, partial [Pirellulales bacterium]|nr:hypothetical protein [Pirellulales bacterium]
MFEGNDLRQSRTTLSGSIGVCASFPPFEFTLLEGIGIYTSIFQPLDGFGPSFSPWALVSTPIESNPFHPPSGGSET